MRFSNAVIAVIAYIVWCAVLAIPDIDISGDTVALSAAIIMAGALAGCDKE